MFCSSRQHRRSSRQQTPGPLSCYRAHSEVQCGVSSKKLTEGGKIASCRHILTRLIGIKLFRGNSSGGTHAAKMCHFSTSLQCARNCGEWVLNNLYAKPPPCLRKTSKEMRKAKKLQNLGYTFWGCPNVPENLNNQKILITTPLTWHFNSLQATSYMQGKDR